MDRRGHVPADGRAVPRGGVLRGAREEDGAGQEHAVPHARLPGQAAAVRLRVRLPGALLHARIAVRRAVQLLRTLREGRAATGMTRRIRVSMEIVGT